MKQCTEKTFLLFSPRLSQRSGSVLRLMHMAQQTQKDKFALRRQMPGSTSSVTNAREMTGYLPVEADILSNNIPTKMVCKPQPL